MAANQSPRHQKRSRASEAAEKAARSNDERVKRRRTSEANDDQSSKKVKASNASQEVPSGDVPALDGEKRKSTSPWSFSRPVGGRYSILDPVMTQDEA